MAVIGPVGNDHHVRAGDTRLFSSLSAKRRPYYGDKRTARRRLLRKHGALSFARVFGLLSIIVGTSTACSRLST